MHIHRASHTCRRINYRLGMQCRWWRPDFFFDRGGCLSPKKNLCENGSQSLERMVKWNRSGTYWCFFCPSVKDPIGLWLPLPDERLRIISGADLIYVLCRWGHPNDLPLHGRHQSPPTRGHGEHAWERERGGTPRQPQGCVYMRAREHALHKCGPVNVFVCAWMCARVCVLVEWIFCVPLCVWTGRGALCARMLVCKCDYMSI